MTVTVVVAHVAVRRLIVELLERAAEGLEITATGDSRDVAPLLTSDPPGLVIVDAGDIAQCCRSSFASLPPDRLIVIGPEPDPNYEEAARRNGVAGWLPRDRVADSLLPLVIRSLRRRRMAAVPG